MAAMIDPWWVTNINSASLGTSGTWDAEWVVNHTVSLNAPTMRGLGREPPVFRRGVRVLRRIVLRRPKPPGVHALEKTCAPAPRPAPVLGPRHRAWLLRDLAMRRHGT